MKKTKYKRPTFEVVELDQQVQLLAGSDVDATMDETWEEVDNPFGN